MALHTAERMTITYFWPRKVDDPQWGVEDPNELEWRGEDYESDDGEGNRSVPRKLDEEE